MALLWECREKPDLAATTSSLPREPYRFSGLDWKIRKQRVPLGIKISACYFRNMEKQGQELAALGLREQWCCDWEQ